ncbi:biopolymer transporter ExbD [Marinobacter hydrocarbonoclasticus]|nr:biopolymer transporter ExbD [Marinobacter nauticus]
MQNFHFIYLLILVFSILGCSEKSIDIITCHGAVTEGHIWVSISVDNQVTIGSSQFSESLLYSKHQLVKQSCESVVVIIQADKSASHKVVYDTIQTIKSMGYQVSQ